MQDTVKDQVDLSLYGGLDPREIPNYGISEVAYYFRIPVATLRSWVKGRPYVLKDGARRFFKPLISLPNPEVPLLSFMNIVEAHMLNAIRRYNVRLPQIREAIDYVQEAFPSLHPLADHDFETDGKSIFIRKLGALINTNRRGQFEMAEIVDVYLHRIKRDSHGVPRRLYPFVANADSAAPKLIMIDPFISFGRPVISNTGISTATVSERHEAGEKVAELAKDYGRTEAEIEAAILYESKLAA